MIGAVVGPDAARRIAQMMGQLAAQRALDEGFLEAANRRIELLMRQRALAHELIENLVGDRCQRRLRRPRLSFRGHGYSSCYAPHTKFLTPPLRGVRRRNRDYLIQSVLRY